MALRWLQVLMHAKKTVVGKVLQCFAKLSQLWNNYSAAINENSAKSYIKSGKDVFRILFWQVVVAF